MNNETALALFTETGALLDGHFQLTSGLHSPHYFQCARVLQYPDKATLLCEPISDHFRGAMPDAVIAPALGGIVVGQEVGRQLNVRTMFSERKVGAMQLRRGFELKAQERVLVCEDVITTGGSVGEVLEIVRRAGAHPVGVAAIVDRSGGKVIFDNCFSVITLKVVTYTQADCPLCRAGIPVEKPGSRALR